MDEITQIKARCFEIICSIEVLQRELSQNQQRLQQLMMVPKEPPSEPAPVENKEGE